MVALDAMASVGASEERERNTGGVANLRESARRFSKILAKSFSASARLRGSDPVELLRLGKVVLESIQFRRSLVEKRRGPKWREEEELRRMERQVWRVLSRLERRPGKRRAELAQRWKELKKVTDSYRASKATALG